jgi:hypothetical protein
MPTVHHPVPELTDAELKIIKKTILAYALRCSWSLEKGFFGALAVYAKDYIEEFSSSPDKGVQNADLIEKIRNIGPRRDQLAYFANFVMPSLQVGPNDLGLCRTVADAIASMPAEQVQEALERCHEIRTTYKYDIINNIDQQLYGQENLNAIMTLFDIEQKSDQQSLWHNKFMFARLCDTQKITAEDITLGFNPPSKGTPYQADAAIIVQKYKERKAHIKSFMDSIGIEALSLHKTIKRLFQLNANQLKKLVAFNNTPQDSSEKRSAKEALENPNEEHHKPKKRHKPEKPRKS